MKKYKGIFTINPDAWQPYQIKPFYGKDAVRITEGTNNLREMLCEVAGVGPLQGYDFETMIEAIDTGLNYLLTFTRLPNGSNFARCHRDNKLVGYLAWDREITRLFISTEIELK